jgi:hypothetical protein
LAVSRKTSIKILQTRRSIAAFHMLKPFAVVRMEGYTPWMQVEAVPVIYTRYAPAQPMTVVSRVGAGIVSASCLAVLCVAAWLQPSHSGIGTHRQLGLEACAFKLRTCLPCPSCGYTTAFAFFAHGNLVASVYTQPMGALLALSAAGMVWVGFYIAITGRPVHRLFKMLPSHYYLMPLLAFALLAWGWKIALALTGHDHW